LNRFTVQNSDTLVTAIICFNIFSKIILSISVNLCDTLNNETDHTSYIDTNLSSDRKVFVEDQAMLMIFHSCIDKAIESLRNNIRCQETRPLHKQALDIYMNFLDNNLNKLKEECGSLMVIGNETRDEDNGQMSLYGQWQQLLYKLIIGIIRILRNDLESNENQLEIELVIYFYELVKVDFFIMYFISTFL
jgi:hypothetical protein